jgi:hypothetical protein
MLIAAGPMMTMISDGKMNSTSGSVILTATVAAFSSARCMRRVRIHSDCTRRAVATLVPKSSVWLSVADSDFRSSTPVRAASRRKASVRFTPAWTSRNVILNSAASSGAENSCSSATRAIAASRPRPASTQVTSRSSVSGNARSIEVLRAETRE